MIITKTKAFTHLKINHKSISQFFEEFKNRYSEFTDQQLIIDFSEKINIKIEEIILFLNLSNQHRENGSSFVLICEDINIDEVPEEINIVPTFTEALDILEMDAIERDLGF